MFFSSPLWLVALLPWGAVAVWLLWGRRKRTDVPFLKLWRGPEKGERVRRSIQAPPLAVALVLWAALFALLASARPAARTTGLRGGTTVTVILDRGITMSARGGQAYR